MLGNILNPNNSFFRTTGKLVDVVLLSLLWLVVSIPVFTLGPATAALYYSVVKCLRRDEPHPYQLFFKSFRENFKVGAIAAVIMAAAAFLLLCGYYWLYLYATAGGMGYVLLVAYCVVVFLLLGVASFLFPVLSRFTSGVGGLIGSSFRLALGHLPSTVLIGLITAAGAYLCLRYWLPVLVVPAVAALLHSALLERIFQPYMPTEGGECDSNELEGDHYDH